MKKYKTVEGNEVFGLCEYDDHRFGFMVADELQRVPFCWDKDGFPCDLFYPYRRFVDSPWTEKNRLVEVKEKKEVCFYVVVFRDGTTFIRKGRPNQTQIDLAFGIKKMTVEIEEGEGFGVVDFFSLGAENPVSSFRALTEDLEKLNEEA